MSQPLVTCLCLTMEGRGEFLKGAVECFRRQTYRNRQLLIVCDHFGDASSVAYFVGVGCVEEGVRIISIGEKLTIGAKRNLGNSVVQNSDLIAHWDDDDYSAPGRIAKQVEELQLTQKSVTGFKAMKFHGSAGWHQFRYLDSGFVLGTSLLYKREWWLKHPFLEINVGEDAAFCEAAAAANQLTEVPDLNLMYAITHGGNTSRRRVTEPGWTPLPGFEWR